MKTTLNLLFSVMFLLTPVSAVSTGVTCPDECGERMLHIQRLQRVFAILDMKHLPTHLSGHVTPVDRFIGTSGWPEISSIFFFLIFLFSVQNINIGDRGGQVP